MRLILSSLSRKDVEITISLHPTMLPSEYRWIESEFSARIDEARIADLIPGCDLFVAAGSSTIALALASGKPVLNLNIWMPNDVFSGASGLVEVTEEQALERVVTDLLEDRDGLDRLRVESESAAEEWGKVDGHAVDRLCSLIEEEAAGKTSRSVETGL